MSHLPLLVSSAAMAEGCPQVPAKMARVAAEPMQLSMSPEPQQAPAAEQPWPSGWQGPAGQLQPPPAVEWPHVEAGGLARHPAHQPPAPQQQAQWPRGQAMRYGSQLPFPAGVSPAAATVFDPCSSSAVMRASIKSNAPGSFFGNQAIHVEAAPNSSTSSHLSAPWLHASSSHAAGSFFPADDQHKARRRSSGVNDAMHLTVLDALGGVGAPTLF